MDITVNDFFNEIDQIAPPKSNKAECVWQECFDSTSGYTYYWNTKTDEVTWETPTDYTPSKELISLTNKSPNMYIPPKMSPLFPSVAISNTKIYKIQEDSNNLLSEDKRVKNTSHQSIEWNKVTDNFSSDIAQEKPAATSSYDNDYKSEEENKNSKLSTTDTTIASRLMTKQNNCNSDSKSDSDDDIDLLTKIQNRAKVLKDLGGELPPDVKKLVELKGMDLRDDTQRCNDKVKKDVTGFSLLAGYGDSEEEEDCTKPVSLDANGSKKSHSTLFPITAPIDVKQYNEVEPEIETSKIQNSKAFHRKRRIDIDLDSKSRDYNIHQKSDTLKTERQGLGFKHENNYESKCSMKTDYLGFKSGGVMFIKPDAVTPFVKPEKPNVEAKDDLMQENNNETNDDVANKMEHIHKTLNEKLTFLNEGKEPASPIQVMIIKMETLYEAVKTGSLTSSYLYNWLKETCAELVKLEKEAAPNGWLLQWDRLNKRYYYYNQQTGDCQWEYPQSDIVGGSEAMDISTTPPPQLVTEDSHIQHVVSTDSSNTLLEPPPPPRIKSPTPPPPPAISKTKVAQTVTSPPMNLETISLPVNKGTVIEEPLPPGVESTEMLTSPLLATEVSVDTKDSIGTALSSFYSDLATLDANSHTEIVIQPPPPPPETSATPAEPPVKKKKTKVKLTQGIAMKKKGVYRLVEKWKSVQKDY